MAQSGPNLDETITVEKKSLFSVLNDDSNDLSVQGNFVSIFNV